MSAAAWIALHVAAFLIGCSVVLVRDRIRRGRWLWQRKPAPIKAGRALDLTSFDAMLREVYPLPGQRLKQWVVDERKARNWTLATCPRREMPAHNDNTGLRCRNHGSVAWVDLSHDCCAICCDRYELAAHSVDVVIWQARTDKPSVTTDRAALSDETVPEWQFPKTPSGDHPFAMLRKERR